VNKRKVDFDFERGEILNINKPAGWTSFEVVRKIREHFRIRKVGHGGTLDPFATGVLLILTGKATRRFAELSALEKEYEGEIELGKVTDTLDVEGTIIEEKELEKFPSLQQIERTCASFIGEIDQVPPSYSALKLEGIPLYKLARQGIQVVPKARKVRIHELEVCEYRPPYLKIRVVCSKGMYMRALARDIGQKLGCGGYLRSLVRIRVGPYRLQDSWDLKELLRLKVD